MPSKIKGNGITVVFDVVTSEKVGRTGKVTSSPVEGNKEIGDHFSKNQNTITISGVCTKDYANKLANLNKLHDTGTICKYTSRNVVKDVVITSFNSNHDGDVHKAFGFDIVLTTVKVSKTEKFTYTTKATPAKAAAQTNKEKKEGTKQTTAKQTDAKTQLKAEEKAKAAGMQVK